MARIIFLGTPDFAVPSLRELDRFCRSQQHELLGVICQPDKPAQRGQALQAPAVKTAAVELQLPVWQPSKITSDFVPWFREQKIDLGVVVAYGKILPQSLLDSASQGFVNVHGSLLPRWRGAAPIQRAIEAGDRETGVCIMKLVAEMDAGGIYHTVKTPIGEAETAGELFARLSEMGACALIDALPGILEGRLKPVEQPLEGVTHAARLRKEESDIDWSRPAEELAHRCRALLPWPGCSSFYEGKRIKLFEPKQVQGQGKPGQILEVGDALVIATGAGAIAFSEAQLDGKRRMSIRELKNGFLLVPGSLFKTDSSR
ncbi:MAG: methionyl-tRNA formyltransferase [Myxococcaceae bacterium]|nr:methionyl-tRNA formyltransferase [Myxococcaceae bacterium]MBH2006527.1 methionyl-tRNA formyltransferase [Myxococcaceae bacterium]